MNVNKGSSGWEVDHNLVVQSAPQDKNKSEKVFPPSGQSGWGSTQKTGPLLPLYESITLYLFSSNLILKISFSSHPTIILLFFYFYSPIHKGPISFELSLSCSYISLGFKTYLFIGIDKLLRDHSHKTPSVDIDIILLSFPTIAKQCIG